MMIWRETLLLASLVAATAGAAAVEPPARERPAGTIAVQLGPREVVMPAGAQGLKYFPDETFAVIRANPPVRVLMAATVSSYLLEGPDMKSLRVLDKVLAPGPKGSYDNGYAGIAGAVRDAKTGSLLAFYHGEDQEGAPTNAAGVPGFYCSVALAVSKDDGRSFEKRGPVITSHQPKKSTGVFDQGCGDLCALLDKDQRFLLIYYSEHSRVDGRGVQTCLARSPVEASGAPGTWSKFYQGGFTEPGLGGHDTPVMSGQTNHADAIFPQVTWVNGLGKYVMVFNRVAYREMAEGRAPKESGLYVAYSEDGLRWSPPVQMLTAWSICQLDKEVAWHPTLWIEAVDARARTIQGWLYYSYSERWGHRAPQQPHHLVRQAIQLRLPAG